MKKKLSNLQYSLETFHRSNQDTSLIHKPSLFKKMKKKLSALQYSLETFHRSNQDTSLIHKPTVFEGDWVQPGDLLADCSASEGGELALGHNILVAYMPWEGYNFEDAILISEKLVYDDIFTSIHIERYETETRQTKLGAEKITREVPDVTPDEVKHLDSSGIAKIGSWVEEGDILVGKITPLPEQVQSPSQKFLYKLLDKKFKPIRDSSLRAPKSIKSKVIKIEVFSSAPMQLEPKSLNKFTEGKSSLKLNPSNTSSHLTKVSYLSTKIHQQLYLKRMNLFMCKPSVSVAARKISVSRSTNHKLFHRGSNSDNKTLKQNPVSLYFPELKIRDLQPPSTTVGTKGVRQKNSSIPDSGPGGVLLSYPLSTYGSRTVKKGVKMLKAKSSKQASIKHFYPSGFAQPDPQKNSIPVKIQIYLAEKRKIQVGDKMAGRHGNKGIISQILPRQDMPYLPDGTPVDIVLNPLGVPSRMNVGQIYECLLGLAGKYLGQHFKIFPFDEIYGPEASRSFVYCKLDEARQKTGLKWLFNPNTPGKLRLFDGRTGDCFEQPITVGRAYMLKLVHMVDDKIHARSTGPYSLVTQQPLRGRSKQGGQRLGEMEVWAIEGYGAAFTLLEMLTIKSDDMTGRMTLWHNLIFNKEISIGTPESFKVLISELQALCLDIGLYKKQ